MFGKNKFAILDFIFTWLLPVAYVGTKVHYIEIDIAWKNYHIWIYGNICCILGV